MPAEFRTRRPSGKPPWPMILLAGVEKSGKSYSAATLSCSELIDRTFWIEIGEGAADQYGALPGARYEIVEHDGTYLDIARAIKAAMAQPRTDGKPHAIVIDSITELWDMLADEQQAIANSRRNRGANGEAPITMDQWNAAKKRWRRMIDALRVYDGPVILTARLESVTVMDDKGRPTTAKSWKVRTEKNLPFEADVVVQIPAPRQFEVTGLRSVRLQMPKDGKICMPDFTLDGLLRQLGLTEADATAPRSYTAPAPDAAEAAADAEQAAEPPTADRHQLTTLNTLLGKKLGLNGDARFPALSSKLQRTITSTAQIKAPEARELIRELSDMPDKAPAADPNKPPENASQLAYDLSMAIDESTTMGDLQGCALGIKAAREQGKLTDPEREWLLAVFDRQQARVAQDQTAREPVGAPA